MFFLHHLFPLTIFLDYHADNVISEKKKKNSIKMNVSKILNSIPSILFGTPTMSKTQHQILWGRHKLANMSSEAHVLSCVK